MQADRKRSARALVFDERRALLDLKHGPRFLRRGNLAPHVARDREAPSRALDRHALQNSLAGALALLLVIGTGSRLIHAIPKAPDWGRQEQGNPLKLADVIAFADVVRLESSPDDTFLEWSREYGEYQVNFLSERRPPTKFTTNVTAMQLIRPDQPVFGEWLSQFDRDHDQRPPKFILIVAA